MSIEADLQRQLERVTVLVQPGWKNSGPAHWQSHWEDKFPEWQRVQQENWQQPHRADWVATLDAAIAASPGRVLVIAHSLGCITLAHWASQSTQPEKLVGALLVAPADVERSTVASPLRSFAPIPRRPLPFPSLLIGSDNDPACVAWRACELAADWQSEFQLLNGAGHINADSRLGDWEDGLARLSAWLQRVHPAERNTRPATLRWAA